MNRPPLPFEARLVNAVRSQGAPGAGGRVATAAPVRQRVYVHDPEPPTPIDWLAIWDAHDLTDLGMVDGEAIMGGTSPIYATGGYRLDWPESQGKTEWDLNTGPGGFYDEVAINGHPAVRFNTSEYEATPPTKAGFGGLGAYQGERFVGVTDLSVFIVADRFNATTVGGHTFHRLFKAYDDGGGSSDGDWATTVQLGGANPPGTLYVYTDDGEPDYDWLDVSDTDTTGVHLYEAHWSQAGVALILDGTVIASGAETFNPVQIDSLYLGFQYAGAVGECRTTLQGLTEDQRTQVRADLASRWDL